MANGYGMNTVTVKRDDLVTKLKANRAGHRGIYEEALQGYQAAVLAELDAFRDKVLNGPIVKVVISLPFPEDHTKDYDRIIAMCEMSVESDLELTSEEFASYVMDDWSWKRAFLTSNAAYSQTATRQL